MTDSAPRAVFLSYASQDAAVVRGLAEALRTAGVEVWFDQNELVGGDAWDQKIRRQIKECALFVPVISAATQARREGYFRLEWKLGAQRTHMMSEQMAFVLPVVIDATRDAEADVPTEFKAVQWTRLPAGESNGKFCARVKQLLADGGSEPAAPGTPAATGRSEPTVPVVRRSQMSARLLGAGAVVGLAVVAVLLWRARSVEKSPSPTSAPLVADGNGSRPASGVETLLRRARSLVSRTDVIRAELDSAIGLLTEAAKLEPTNARVWAEMALVECRYFDEYLDRSAARLDSARRHAAQAIGFDPDAPIAIFAQASAITLDRRRAAGQMPPVKRLAAVIDQIVDRPDALYLLANLGGPDISFESRVAWVDRAARMPGQAGRASLERGSLHFAAGHVREAGEELKRSLAEERSTKALLMGAFFHLVWDGDKEAAQRVMAEVPADVWSEDYAASARFFVRMWAGQPQEAYDAINVPRDFIESMALSGPTGYYRGYALSRAGKQAGAEMEWRAALAVVQRELASRLSDHKLLTFQALLQWELGDRPAALKTWQSIKELTGGMFVSWENYFLQMSILPVEEAIARLEASSHPVWQLSGTLRLDPFLDRLRSHPRFQALLAKAEADPKLSPRAPRVATPEASSVEEKSVVVLPLENLSMDPQLASFTDGMHVEIISMLETIPGLKVILPTSAMQFKGTTIPLAEIARRLGVANVITGSVRRSGSIVRIQLNLRRAHDEVLLWALPQRDRTLDDILTLQSEVADQVARALQAREAKGAVAAARFMTKSPRAFDAFVKQRGVFFRAFENNPLFAESIRIGEEAFELDKTFMLPAQFLSVAHAIIRMSETDPARRMELAAKSKRWAEIASRLAPGGAGDLATVSHLFYVEKDYARGLAVARQGVRALPNDGGMHNFLGLCQEAMGLSAEAAQSFQRALADDPLMPVINQNLLRVLVALRRTGPAEEVIARLESLPGLQSGEAIARARFRLRGDIPNIPTPAADIDWFGSEGNSARAVVEWRWRERKFSEVVEIASARLRRTDLSPEVLFDLHVWQARALHALGDQPSAARAAERAAALLADRSSTDASDASLLELRHASVCLMQGRREDAIAAALRAVNLVSETAAPQARWWAETEFAEILAQAGRSTESIDVITRLLQVPSRLTVPMLRVEPNWDALRAEPRFQALVADTKNSAPL